MATEKVERQERIREEGDFSDKEKFITESYQKQLDMNKKEQMIHQMEDKLNESKTLSNTGMMNFYNKMLDNKLGEPSKDIREQAKETVSKRTNIDKVLDQNEMVREQERIKKENI